MPKIKTNRAAAKRFRVTGSGKKIRRYKAYKSHLLTKKARSRKRRLRKPGILNGSNIKEVKRLIPYG